MLAASTPAERCGGFVVRSTVNGGVDRWLCDGREEEARRYSRWPKISAPAARCGSMAAWSGDLVRLGWAFGGCLEQHRQEYGGTGLSFLISGRVGVSWDEHGLGGGLGFH
ncbi:hypothetical protein M0R45_001141 [Rubus argutus]|uniref:Uncharacterized protein n=1 Tax=Rubus argutus TaxID=59490 RepID=A0AAW1VNT2_RUBAR